MKSDPSDQAELLLRLRQQLILAQVRIMELEDARDDIATRQADAENLRRVAQTVADQKIDEATHLGRVQQELQGQYEHLRHMQHVTNEALVKTRVELTAVTESLGSAEQVNAALQAQIGKLQAAAEDLRAQIASLSALASDRAQRVEQLDGEQNRMKQSRSWRWTAWLRSLERSFGRK